MFYLGKLIALSLVIIASISTTYADQENYKIRQGDILDISVWGEKELSKEIIVLPDGSISFPLTGRVVVAGLGSQEIAEKITVKLKKFLPDPEVTVIVKSAAGNRVYVLGKVLKPGIIALQGPLTVLQALSISGGFDKFADKDEIKIIREKQVLFVDYEDLVKGEQLESNYLLRAGDTILVP